jgi:GDP-L-fucose synthase
VRRVLVTGGNGFLGRVVVRRLEEAGHTVVAPRSFEYDLRTRIGCVGALVDAEPEVVIHLAAAVGGIGANEAHPGQFLFENLIMGAELMDQARRAGVGKFVSVGTACSYPEAAVVPLVEETIWDGYPAPVTAPYGLAKRMLMEQGRAYRTEYGFNAIHLIPTNLYGPGDNFDPETGHVIPSLISKFAEAAEVEAPVVVCWGTGKPTREFLYVDDAARGIVLAMERYDSPEPVNLGTGAEVSICEVAEKIADLYGFEGRIEWDASRPDGVSRRCLDVSRARAFGFSPIANLDDGLAETVEWFERMAGTVRGVS